MINYINIVKDYSVYPVVWPFSHGKCLILSNRKKGFKRYFYIFYNIRVTGGGHGKYAQKVETSIEMVKKKKLRDKINQRNVYLWSLSLFSGLTMEITTPDPRKHWPHQQIPRLPVPEVFRHQLTGLEMNKKKIKSFKHFSIIRTRSIPIFQDFIQHSEAG